VSGSIPLSPTNVNMQLLNSRANKLTHEQLRRGWKKISWNEDTVEEFTKLACKGKKPYDEKDDARK
jgi:hypothetical protein